MVIIKLLATSILLLGIQTTVGQTPPIRVLASPAMKTVINELKPELERQLGRNLYMEVIPSAVIGQRVESGEHFDVALVQVEAGDDLQKRGRIVATSVRSVGRSRIRFGVRPSAVQPNVQTRDSVRQALLDAKAVTWGDGDSADVIVRLIKGLGIGSEIKSKTTVAPNVEEAALLVSQDKIDLLVGLASEILPLKTLQVSGPLPDGLETDVSYVAGISPKSSIPAASALFIRILSSAPPRLYEANGMDGPSGAGIRGRAPIK